MLYDTFLEHICQNYGCAGAVFAITLLLWYTFPGFKVQKPLKPDALEKVQSWLSTIPEGGFYVGGKLVKTLDSEHNEELEDRAISIYEALDEIFESGCNKEDLAWMCNDSKLQQQLNAQDSSVNVSCDDSAFVSNGALISFTSSVRVRPVLWKQQLGSIWSQTRSQQLTGKGAFELENPTLANKTLSEQGRVEFTHEEMMELGPLNLFPNCWINTAKGSFILISTPSKRFAPDMTHGLLALREMK